jgi:NAD(P)H-hydrate epimerase
MRVVTAAAMAAIDRETIAGGVSGLELMERAGREMCWQLVREFPDLEPPARVLVLCGRGNNGGDGLVVARLLEGLGFEVVVVLTASAADLSPDAAANLARLPESVSLEICDPGSDAERVRDLCEEADLVLDAVLGTGVRLPLRDGHAALFAAVNAAGAPVAALDIPSGVCGDDGAVDPVAVRADVTITVGLPKLGLLLPPGRDHVGVLSVVDIGFPVEICERHAGDLHWLLPEDLADLLPRRPSDLHKYTAGTVLVLAGSRRYGGAALLAGLGALRSGAGLVTLALPAEHAGAALSFVPEAPVRALPTGPTGGLVAAPDTAPAELLAKQRALAVGPGLGVHPDTDAFVSSLLEQAQVPTVVDADALGVWSRAGREPSGAGYATVLTPHAGELARMAGIAPEELAARRLEIVPELARRWQVVLVAKGAPTLIAAPDGTLWINPTGGDALSHGGTGDVLTGLLGGLLGQGLDGLEAALLGCWLHGRAGELAAAAGSGRSVLAREVAEALPVAFAELEALGGGRA